MPKKPTPHGGGKRGGDGLTDRERAFAHGRRKDPGAEGWVIAKRAGFMGDKKKLAKRASELMHKPLVLAALTAPMDANSLEEISDEDLKKEIRRRFRAIVNSPRATDSDAIKAGDKLLATIAGGYVPVQVKAEGKFTLESWVAAMGGAPEDPALTAHEEEA